MLKIKEDIPLEELEKYGFMYWDKGSAKVAYFKFILINKMIVQILRDRSIDFQLPIGSIIKREDIRVESFIDDLIQAGIVVKE